MVVRLEEERPLTNSRFVDRGLLGTGYTSFSATRLPSGRTIAGRKSGFPDLVSEGTHQRVVEFARLLVITSLFGNERRPLVLK